MMDFNNPVPTNQQLIAAGFDIAPIPVGPTGGSPSPNPKNVSSIKDKLLRPALTSHFQCWFNPPQAVRDWSRNKGTYYDGNEELISLSCSEASLPGSSFMTNEITDDYTGVTERHAYRRQYDDRSDFTFYVDYGRSDGNYNVLCFFENWMSYIANEQFAEGVESKSYNYRMNYPEDYQSSALYLNKFERDYVGNYLEYRFLQAYPISIASMPVSYDSSQLLKCTVSFTYTRYLISKRRLEIEKEPSQEKAPGVPDISKYYGPGLPGNAAIENWNNLIFDSNNNPNAIQPPVLPLPGTGEPFIP